jgi:hypothetical protein
MGQFAFKVWANHDGITARGQKETGLRTDPTEGLLLADSPVDMAYLAVELPSFYSLQEWVTR